MIPYDYMPILMLIIWCKFHLSGRIRCLALAAWEVDPGGDEFALALEGLGAEVEKFYRWGGGSRTNVEPVLSLLAFNR